MITTATHDAVRDACRTNGWTITFDGVDGGVHLLVATRDQRTVTVRFSESGRRRRSAIVSATISRNGHVKQRAASTGKRETVIEWLNRASDNAEQPTPATIPDPVASGPREEPDSPRFWWVEADAAQPSTHAFGEHTAQIVDEEAGGAVAYCHDSNADWITAALNTATDRTEPDGIPEDSPTTELLTKLPKPHPAARNCPEQHFVGWPVDRMMPCIITGEHVEHRDNGWRKWFSETPRH